MSGPDPRPDRGAVLRSRALDPQARAHLRLAEANEPDAAFIAKLRTDPELSRYLNAAAGGIEGQLKWLQDYKLREAAAAEFYFIVVADGQAAGVIRLYDFGHAGSLRTFAWGSWIMLAPRAPGLVTHTLLLAYEVAFEALGFDRALFDARNNNAVAIALYLRAGARVVARDDRDTFFAFDHADYVRFRDAPGSQAARARWAS